MRAKITQIGNSTGLIIPKEIVTAMNIKKGDDVFLSPTKDGFIIKHYDVEIERQLKIADEGMTEYRHMLHKLADS